MIPIKQHDVWLDQSHFIVQESGDDSIIPTPVILESSLVEDESSLETTENKTGDNANEEGCIIGSEYFG